MSDLDHARRMAFEIGCWYVWFRLNERVGAGDREGAD